MKKQRFVRKVVATAVLAAFGASGMALADAEMEPNHPMSSAQKLVVTGDLATGKGGAVVDGAITHGAQPDVDFYSFYAQAGDVITLDIDGTNFLDSYLTLFGPGFSWPLENDDAGLLNLDSGSTSFYDSMLLDIPITVSGTYTVAVTAYGTLLSPNGTYDTTWIPDTSGGYTLVLSGVSLPPVAEPGPTPVPDPVPEPPQVAQIDIHVKPGVVTRSRVDGKAKGVIPVVLMSSSSFNAMNVDAKTVTFGKTGVEGHARQCSKGGHDFNKDGRPDLLCHFENHVSGFEPGDLEAFVKGKTTDGGAFEGRGALKAHPDKRERSAAADTRQRPGKGKR
jgi:hypothetical protein